MASEARLDAILTAGAIRGFTGFRGGLPVVCFTESNPDHLIGQDRFAPWGIAVTRQWVYDQGGGPIWYTRQDVLDAMVDPGELMRTWAVRLEAGASDWLDERGWVVPLDPADPHLRLDPPRVIAITIGEPDWTPTGIEVNHEELGFPYAEMGDFRTLGPVHGVHFEPQPAGSERHCGAGIRPPDAETPGLNHPARSQIRHSKGSKRMSQTHRRISRTATPFP